MLAGGAVLALAAACGGSRTAPFRIGVLSDCFGPFNGLHQVVVGSAELPLLERGGRLRGQEPSDGVEGARAGGHPVQLLVGCVGSDEDVLPESRRLVEEDHVRVLIGLLTPQAGLVLRDYARRRPATAFLIQPSAAPELTLNRAAPNVYRFAADAAQSVAGLGSYAYHVLGWRTAVTIGDDIPYGWENVAGFVAEFCGLGGRLAERRWVAVGSDPSSMAAEIPSSVDGVYVGTLLSPMAGFLKRYAGLHPDFAHRLLFASFLLNDPQIAPLARGVVVGGIVPLEPTPAEGSYLAAFAKAFPGLAAGAALTPEALAYRNGVEAALEALERTGGGRGFLAALARVRIESPTGSIGLDRDRQGVLTTYLSRIAIGPKGKPVLKTVRAVRNVEQTFGGYFTAGSRPPSRTSPACVKRTPPPWAR